MSPNVQATLTTIDGICNEALFEGLRVVTKKQDTMDTIDDLLALNITFGKKLREIQMLAQAVLDQEAETT